MPGEPAQNQPSAQGGQNPAGWPDDDWPDDEDWPDDASLAIPWPEPESPWPGTEIRQPRGWLRRAGGPAAVAVLAAGAGAGLALYLGGPGGGSPAVAGFPPAASPRAGAPGQGGSGGTLPGGGIPGSGAVTQMFIVGQIAAISRTSITIGTGGRSVTAAITSATRVSGNVHNVAALAVGDLVSAQITETNSRATANTIQDPPGQQPPLSGTP